MRFVSGSLSNNVVRVAELPEVTEVGVAVRVAAGVEVVGEIALVSL